MFSLNLRRKPPRKLDRIKCENCRQAKKKCVSTELGCMRCREKEVDCPGRTKAGASSKRTSLSPQDRDTRLSPSSFNTTENQLRNNANHVKPQAALSEQPQSQKDGFNPNSLHEQIAHAISDPLPEQITHAMEEIDGLESGWDLVDSLSDYDGVDEDFCTEPSSLQSPTVHESETALQNPTVHESETRCDVVATDLETLPESLPNYEDFTAYIMSQSTELALVDEFTRWMSQLQIRCDGHFVCISPTCKLRFIEPSGEALEKHYNKHHAGIGSKIPRRQYSRLGGLFDMHIDMCIKKAALSRVEWNSWTIKEQHDQLALENERFKQKTSGYYKVISQTRQFEDLRALKKAFRTRYNDFLRTSDSSPELSRFATMLRSNYRNSRGLHRLGFRVFRAVLAGTAPTTVLEVFAFELLSGAMTNVMRNVWNKDIPHQPQDIDYLVWRNAIQDNNGKVLFDHLMHNWFPHSLLVQLDTSALKPFSHEVMRDYILDLVCPTEATEPSNFSAFSTSEIAKNIYGTGECNHEMDRGSFDSLWGINSASWKGGALQVTPKLMTIRDSIIFLGVYLFMIYVTERGILVIYLGNQDRRCKLLGSEATAGNILQVSERLKNEVIDPLLTAFSDAPVFPGLLKAAKVMIDYGQTWSVEQLHGILKGVVKDAVDDPELQTKWLTVVDLKCQFAQTSIVSACGL